MSFWMDNDGRGIRILSNLLEMGFDDVALMRIYGWRLQQEGEFSSAIAIFQRILDLRSDEPQSYTSHPPCTT